MKMIDLLFPPICAACGLPSKPGETLCAKCAVDWETAKTRQLHRHGGVPVYTFSEEFGERAGSAIFLVAYVPEKRQSAEYRLIHRLKRHADRSVVQFFADELAELIRQNIPQPLLSACILTWIPRKIGNRLQYGFDHMQRVAKVLGRNLSVPCEALLKRSAISKEQKRLGAAERRENAQKTIRRRETAKLEDQVVLLIDDIVTSGASMAAATNRLLEGGARMVIGVSICATEHIPPKGKVQDYFLVKGQK